MKKIIICNIPMAKEVNQNVYVSDDKSLPVTDRPVRYSINAFLEKTLKPDDEVKVLLLAKIDEYSYYEQNIEYFINELNEANSNIGAKLEYKTIDTAFSQERTIHEQLLSRIVDEIDPQTHVLADITYGSKDMSIVVFTTLGFAEKFLECSIDNIVYGQANFVNGKAINTKICDMIPLYALTSVTNVIRNVEPNKAKQMLKSLLSIQTSQKEWCFNLYYDKEKYEALILQSQLFAIDKEASPTLYEREKYRMKEYLYCYLMALNEKKYEAYSCEILKISEDCIKAYDSTKGVFLHYFNAAWKKE